MIIECPEAAAPQEPDMMVLERRLTPSSGRLGAQGGGQGPGPADTRPASSQEGGGWGQAPREPDVLVLGSRRTPRRGIWEAQGWAAGPGPRTAAPRRSVTAAPPPCQGVNRFINRGNGIISRTCGRPVIHATVRSSPSPKPEWVKVP